LEGLERVQRQGAGWPDYFIEKNRPKFLSKLIHNLPCEKIAQTVAQTFFLKFNT
jgi:hypothetical protein